MPVSNINTSIHKVLDNIASQTQQKDKDNANPSSSQAPKASDEFGGEAKSKKTQQRGTTKARSSTKRP